jgi:hypothetical protein
MNRRPTDISANGRTLTAEQQARVAADQTTLLYSNLPLSVSITLLVAAILTYALIGYVSHLAIGGWFGAMLLVCVFRMALWYQWKRRQTQSSTEQYSRQ